MRLTTCIPLCAALCLVLAGCGGGGGGGDGGEDGAGSLVDAAASTAILFPPAGSLAESSQITVVGSIAAPGEVAAVRVNGLFAASGDGFATWRVAVPLQPGTNTLRVDLEDADGETAEDVAVLSLEAQSHFLSSVRRLAKAPSTSDYYLFDFAAVAIFHLDATTRATELVSGPGRGGGPDLERLAVEDLVVDEANDRVLVLEDDGILAVDLGDGDRTVLADVSVGSGPNLEDARAFDIEPGANRVVVAEAESPDFLVLVDLTTGDRTLVPTGLGPVLDSIVDVAVVPGQDTAYVAANSGGFGRVLEVDLTTGDRSVVSEDGVRGTGPAFGTTRRILWGGVVPRIYVADSALRALFEVDPATGDRTILADATTGSGVEFDTILDITGDLGNDQVVFCDQVVDSVVAVDRITGARTSLYGHGHGRGQSLRYPEDLDLDPATNTVYVLDSRAHRLFAVEPGTGNRVLTTDDSFGPAAPWSTPVGLDLDLAQNRAYVVDKTEDALYRVNLATGSRTVISSFDLAVGGGPDWNLPHGVSLDLPNGRAWICDSSSGPEGGVYRVDLASGERVKISDDLIGLGVPFQFAEGCVFDPVRGHVVVSDQGADALIEVDVATGDRSVLTDDVSIGAGPPSDNPHDVDLDLANDRALVPDDHADALFAVDLASGNRTILSGPGRGTGPALHTPEHAVVGPNGHILLVDLGLGALLLIEPGSGDRVILSR